MLNIIYYLLAALALNLIMFLFAYKFKTDKLTDVSYALTFIILVTLSFFIGEYSKIKLILFFMILLWAFRIGVFLFIRIRNMEKDKRFDGIREDFLKFLKFWALQGITVWIILLPSLIFFQSTAKITIFSGIGFAIWFIGLTIETFADIQKFQFNKNNKGGLWISTELWKYSRHPNYFGEICCWLGVYLFTFSTLTGLQKLYTFISPLGIALLLIFVTGLPKLEEYADKKWGKMKEYKEYKRKTSILIPWFQKK
jgi:steroid 5-alpha reductase family enzyme